MKPLKNIFTLIVGALFEPGAFGPMFLFFAIVALILRKGWIFWAPFIILFGGLILWNAIVNDHFWH